MALAECVDGALLAVAPVGAGLEIPAAVLDFPQDDLSRRVTGYMELGEAGEYG